jgi:hypothetical protein
MYMHNYVMGATRLDKVDEVSMSVARVAISIRGNDGGSHVIPIDVQSHGLCKQTIFGIQNKSIDRTNSPQNSLILMPSI